MPFYSVVDYNINFINDKIYIVKKERDEIERLKKLEEEKLTEFTKESFPIGAKVRYSCSDGSLKGEVKGYSKKAQKIEVLLDGDGYLTKFKPEELFKI